MKKLFADILAATHIDVHHDMKLAWQALIKKGLPAKEVTYFSKPPVTEKEFWMLVDKWDDNLLRNKKIQEWVEISQKKYQSIAHKKNS